MRWWFPVGLCSLYCKIEREKKMKWRSAQGMEFNYGRCRIGNVNRKFSNGIKSTQIIFSLLLGKSRG